MNILKRLTIIVLLVLLSLTATHAVLNPDTLTGDSICQTSDGSPLSYDVYRIGFMLLNGPKKRIYRGGKEDFCRTKNSRCTVCWNDGPVKVSICPKAPWGGDAFSYDEVGAMLLHMNGRCARGYRNVRKVGGQFKPWSYDFGAFLQVHF